MEGNKIEGTKLTLLKEKAYRTKDYCWMGLYQCDCGTQKLIRNKDVKNGKTKSCGCLKRKNSKIIQEGQRVPDSYLTLLKEKAEKRYENWLGLYKCDCGEEKLINNTDVRSGKIKSCGCYRKEKLSALNSADLTGQHFGRWTVLSRVLNKTGHGSIWLCQCECGTIKEIEYTNLVSGKSKSCGCLRSELYFDDITGQRFGRLIAIEPNWKVTRERKQGTVFWNCKCDCGNLVIVSNNSLKQLNTTSCGCLISKGEQKIKEILNSLNIQYETQKQFSDLLGVKNGKLRFDFYLPQYNIALEYQGEQHYKNIEHWDGQEGLQTRQIHDQLKRNYCLKNRIKLIEIPYTDFNLLNDKYILNLFGIEA